MSLTLRTYPLEYGVTGRAIFCEHSRQFVGDDAPCHRYALYRETDHRLGLSLPPDHRCRTLATIGMNPSAAAADVDDLTVRMWWNMAKRARCCKLVAVNAYAWCATDPKELANMPVDEAIGKKNDFRIFSEVNWADLVLACWGSIAADRDAALRAILRQFASKVYCLGLTNSGRPRHPRGVVAGVEWQRLPLDATEQDQNAAVY